MSLDNELIPALQKQNWRKPIDYRRRLAAVICALSTVCVKHLTAFTSKEGGGTKKNSPAQTSSSN